MVNDWGSSKSMKDIIWEKVEDNDIGLETMALCKDKYNSQICGWNGVLEGDWVWHNSKEYRVVMSSRLGDFGLSYNGKLPYEIRVSPNEVLKVRF